MTNQAKISHPKEIWMLFMTEMWERFNYYGMKALLVLYMVYDLFAKRGDFGDSEAYIVYAAFASLVYATPYIGGTISDRILGRKKAIVFGAIIMAIGEFMMMIPNQIVFYIALSFIIMGNGFFKPNIASLVGGLYKEGDPRRDSGFTIFYMGVNLGAALAPICTAIVMDIWGFNYAFGLAGVGMLIGLFVFVKGKSKLGDNGNPPDINKLNIKHFGIKTEHLIYIGSIVVVPIFVLLLIQNTIVQVLFPLFGIFVLISLLYNAFKETKEGRQRLFVVIILIAFSVMFWAFFEQAGSSLTLFTEININRQIGNWLIPTPLFQAINPIFILLLSPLFAAMWIRMNQRGREPSTPLKFAIALILLGAGFGAVVWGASFANGGMVPVIFLILLYLLHTAGELSLSPVGLSMVTKLSPKRIVGMVMGAWMLSNAFALHIMGMIAQFTSTDQYMEKCISYEPKFGASGSDQIAINVYDADSLVSETLAIDFEIVSNPQDAIWQSPLTVFPVYRSMKPQTLMKLNMRIPHLDPLGNLTKIEIVRQPSNGSTQIIGDSLAYKPNADFIGSDTIQYLMIEYENVDNKTLVELIVLVDELENHPPQLVKNRLSVKVWEKPWYTKSVQRINVLNYFYDPDGDELGVNLLTQANFAHGQAKVVNSLNAFVSPGITIHIYMNVFRVLAIIAIAVGVVLLLLVPILKKWMHKAH